MSTITMGGPRPPQTPLRAAILLLAAFALIAGCGRPFTAATPQGFLDLGTRYPDGEYRATTPDGVVIGIRAYDNDPRGELSFWSRALERRMREAGGYALIDKRDVRSRDGMTGVEMRFGHDEGKEPYLYDVALFASEKKIFVIEAGGTKTEMTRQEAQIDWAVRNFAQR
jgi:hypothetical protein